MNGFVQRHRDVVMGMLSGFDRLRFRGTLRWLCYAAGLGRHLSASGVLYAVEPCNSFRIGKDPAIGHIEVYNAQRKCLHYYSYWMDPQWGFCHVRAQTWFPLNLHVYVNGREWRARQMDRAGMAYERRLNSFTWLENLEGAQALMDRQRFRKRIATG